MLGLVWGRLFVCCVDIYGGKDLSRKYTGGKSLIRFQRRIKGERRRYKVHRRRKLDTVS